MTGRADLSSNEPAPRTYFATLTVSVEVTVRDPDVVERITGPEGDIWRSQMYKLYTEHDAIAHLAINAFPMDGRSIHELDGWADLTMAAGGMNVLDVDVDEIIGPDGNRLEEGRPVVS